MEFVTRPNGRLAEKDFNEERRVVRVIPANDQLRKYLKHPSRGSLNAEGSTEWPNDQFTRRRIKAGDVTVEEAAAKGEGERVIDPSGAKAPGHPETDRRDTREPQSETSGVVDPNKTSAPKQGTPATTQGTR